MPRLKALPEACDALLAQLRVPVPRVSRLTGTVETEAVRRLSRVCQEIVKRFLEEPLDTRFGAIGGFVDEATSLASDLGFQWPPIEHIHYLRECADGTDEHSEKTPILWRAFFHRHNEFKEAWGYRLHDPSESTGFEEIMIAAIAECDEPGKPKEDDPWGDESKVGDRLFAVPWLQRWVRYLDNLAESLGCSAEASAESQPSQPAKHANDVDSEDARHSDDFRSVDWFRTLYSFTANQASAVEVLWKNWENKTPEVSDMTLLDRAGGGKKARIADLFRGSPAWKTMIVPGETKGTHRLNPPSGVKT